MPQYMLQLAYTPESWKSLARNPEDRTGIAESVAKQLGGRLISFYYHFGEYDATVIAELPDDTAANAVAVAVLGSGGFRATKTTRLFSIKEAVEAFGKAGKVAYQPPGKK